jgi:sarcosine oxidase
VVCPGAWAAALLADLGVSLRVERQVMYWFDADARLFSDNPVFLWEAPDGVQFYGFPAIDGPGAGVKTAFHNAGGVDCDPDTIDRVVRPHEVEAIRSYLAPRVPGLPGALIRTATCMYTNTPDHHFVVAVHPEHPQVSVACGCSGHGFKFTPVIGEILADLAVNGVTRHPIGLFDPRRSTARPLSLPRPAQSRQRAKDQQKTFTTSWMRRAARIRRSCQRCIQVQEPEPRHVPNRAGQVRGPRIPAS